MENERKKEGRPVILDEAAVDKLIAQLDHMVVIADAQYEVTVDMVRRRARCKAGNRTIPDALHARKVYFRRLREKPVLTDDDIKARIAFARKFMGKTEAWWRTFVHMRIDVKHFPVYLNGRARAHAAREDVRGAYRTPGEGLEAPYVKHGKKCPAVMISLVAVGLPGSVGGSLVSANHTHHQHLQPEARQSVS